MQKKLIIELRSDLCAGTGKGFAQVIDIDTAVDAYGIPYIPGRRIKGCLRELAEDILHEDKETINKLFGVSGDYKFGSLSIGDARIKNYDSQLEQIRHTIGKNRNENNITPNDITELFCSVRSSTALENETVKDGSLRFVRVVNRVSPLDQEPMKFYADISFDDNDENIVEKLIKGLRNIGYHRNRGLGYVKCHLEEETPRTLKIEGTYGKESALEYLLYLESNLMLPASDANHSLDYIPGTSVLGALASKYLKQDGKTDEDGFTKLFLSNKVRFSNLYISDSDGTDYIPAPSFLAKIKAAGSEKESKIYNLVAEESSNEDRRSKGETTPQYKPLKKGYISWEKGYKEPKTEIVYHNAINTDDGGLYTQYCLSAGQYFKGRIEAPIELLEKLEPLFADGVVYLGRSKTAQYARCRIELINRKELNTDTSSFEAGKIAAFLCESDIVLLQDGRYTVQMEALCKALEESADVSIPVDSLNKFTNISSRVVSGYNAKWNLKKPQFPVIKAGSVVLFKVSEPKEAREGLEDCYFVGTKQNEGFGRVRLISDVEAMEVPNADESDGEELYCELLQAVKTQKENDKILEDGIKLADDKISKKSINASQIGRLTLMCKESADYNDFIRRINSIKTDDVREKALDCFGTEKLPEYIKEYIKGDWQNLQKLFRTALAVSKYKLKASVDKNNNQTAGGEDNE